MNKNKYRTYDIRIALLEQLIIVMTLGLLVLEKGNLWIFDLIVWCFIFIMTLIQTYKIWKGKNNDSI